MPNIEKRERKLQAKRDKCHVTFRDKPIRLTSDFTIQTLKSRKVWNEIPNSKEEKQFSAKYAIFRTAIFHSPWRSKIFAL